MLAQYDEKDGFSFLNGGEIADDVADALNKLQPGMIATSDDFEKLAKKLGTSDQKFINFCTDLKNGNITLKEGQTYLQAYQENVTSLSARLKSFATSTRAFFKNLGWNLLAGTINALGGMLISSVVSLIGVGVSKLYKQISGKAAEEAKQEIQQLGETARSEFDSIQQNLSSTISTVDEVKQHYAELAQGVGDLGKATQNQGTLTTDDYKDFLDISNQLSDLFPTLTQGYDDNGNAIINLNGDVNTITSSLEHLIDVQKEVAAQEMSDKMPDIYKDYRQTVDDYANKYNNTQESATGYDYLRVNYKNVDSFYGIDGVDKKELRKALEDQGLDDDTVELLMDYGAKNLNQIAQQKAQKALQNLYEKYSEEVNKYADKIEQENKKFGVQVSQILYNDATYQDIAENDSTKKSIIDSIIPNLNYDTLSAGFDGEWKDAYKEIIQEQVIDAINSIDDDSIKKEFNDLLNDPDLTIDEKSNYLQQITDYFNNLFGEDNVITLTLKPQIEETDSLKQSRDNVANQFEKTLTEKQNQQLNDVKQNLQDEYQKISDWGLDDYANQIKNSTIQSTFGNVDMDKRTIIHWSDELKQTYADALASWDYDPEVGSIDTVFGGSQRFGEELNGNGWEIAFTPILPDGTFLSSDTVYEYIEKIVEQAYANDGQVTDDELKKIDAQGMKIGDTFVHGIYAGVDASQNYDNNGNWAETVGRLMHFSGKDGAVQIAEKNISNLEKQFGANGSQKILDFFDSEGINTQEEIDEFNNIYTTTEQAKKGIYDADVAIQEWTKHKKESIESTSSLSDYFSKDQEYLEYISQLGKVGKIDEDSIQSLKDYDKLLEMCGGDAKKLVEELQKISKESNGTNGSIEAANNLATTDKGYKALNEAYQQAMQNGFVDSTTISSLYDQFGDLDVFDKFVEAMQNIGNAAYDTQEAFNSLSNEYASSKINLNDLTDATAEQYRTELTKQGVENASEAIDERLAYMNKIRVQALQELNAAKITSITTTDALNNATADEINSIIDEVQAAGGDTSALKQVSLAKQGVNAAKISTTTDVSELLSMAKAAGVGGTALSWLTAVKNGNIKDTKAAEAAMNSAKSAILKAVNDFNIQFTPYNYTGGTGGTSTSGGSGGSGSSSSKTETAFDKLSDWASQFFDWIEVRLDRLQKKIDSNISKAESKLNDKRYSSATSYYMSAVGGTYEKLYNTQRGRDKYQTQASSYLNQAVSLGAISSSLAKEIKSRVADGSINISKYSSDIQTVINTYKDWIDKAKDCTTAMQTLHDSLRTYAEDLKKVSDAQRDATVSMAETKQTIATGGVKNTSTAKNSALNYNNLVLDVKNKAYSTATRSATKNVNKLAGSANYGINTAKKGSKKYNTTLSNIKGYIKKRVVIPGSLLAIVAKNNPTLYNRLYMYNLGIENLKTAREEYITAYSANSAEKYNNIADKYKNLDDATNDAMDLYNSKSSNSVYAKNKNSYLDKQKSGYGSIVNRDVSERNKYASAVSSYKKIMSKSARGTSLSALSIKSRSVVRKYVDTAKSYAKQNKNIPDSIIGKLSEYVTKGYISSSFLYACINYNNTLESYNQAKAQAEIDKQTQIAQRAEIASQKFSNIATEYDNKRHTYEQTATELNNKMSILEAKGNGASDVWYQRLYTNEQNTNSNLVSKRKDLIDSLNKSVKNGDIQKYSTEWYNLRSQIDDVTNSIDESTKSLQEYQNQMEQIKWDRIDEGAQKIQNFVDENDFMINELSRRDLTSDDTGGLTKEGDAVAGLHIANYKAYQEQAQSYANAITDINKKLADDPYNQRYIEQKEKLVKSYQDATKAAQDEKFSTIDLMKSGYDALKNHISDLINKYQDLIDSEKDAYDYANNISEKTKTLSDLHKQLIALSGDTSEESRAKIQQLNVSLKDAEKDLKDTQYDKLISSTKDMLSNFQTDLDDSIQDIIKNLDDEFNKLIASIDEKWGTSSETVSSLMDKINYTEQFDKLLGDGGVLNDTKTVLDGILSFCNNMWAEYDSRAKTTHTYNNTAGQNSSSGGGKTNGSSSGSGSKPKPTFIGIPAGNLTPTAYEKKKIETFISQNKLKATKKREQYGLLNRTLYDNYGKIVMTAAKWKELAQLLGFSTYSESKTSPFWKKMHSIGIKGFKKGSDSIPYDMIANLGENGTELQYDVSKGVLKSVGQSDIIFTAEQAKTLMEFAKNPMAYKNMYTGTAFSMPSVPVNNKVDNDVNVTFGDIHMDGVNDPNTFAKTLIDVYKNNTANARKMLKEDTIGSLSKGYNSQSVKRW